MYENLEFLKNHCIGTAESEKSFIDHVFYDSGKYTDIAKRPTGSPIILIGKKGTGKSALIQYLSINANESKINLCVLCDFVVKNIFDNRYLNLNQQSSLQVKCGNLISNFVRAYVPSKFRY